MCAEERREERREIEKGERNGGSWILAGSEPSLESSDKKGEKAEKEKKR